MYNSVQLAKFIAAYFNAKNADINMTKVQKLTYITYGIYLALKDDRIIEEHPQAWPYGPVFPTTRNKLSKIDLNTICLEDEDLSVIKKDEYLNKVVDLVYRSFGDWSATRLSDWSHKEGSPWEKTVSTQGFKWGNRIDDEYIKSYFRKILVPKND
ncbi:MAG: DUF4065 domain-containing protein [Prevotella sp.]|jgi:uncharacterized phage-associated protein|nr:DUF4065 domain-containing protein [Prevotella sp.]